MSQLLIALSTWFHALATVVFVGHYLLLSAIYLPVLGKSGNGAALSAISKQSRPWQYAALFIFIATGTHLMLIDPEYLGLMRFGNLWGMLMVAKHILIVGMIAAGFWYNAILRVGPQMRSSSAAEQAVARFRQYCIGMTVAGMLVLLLTAVAQVL